MWQRAVVLDADDPEAHWVLGLTYLWLRQHDRAIGEARWALSLDPNFLWAHTLLGLVQLYDGHSQAAVAPLETAMRLDPMSSFISWRRHTSEADDTRTPWRP
jgi:tetratricopeptide (TPR) repeat protein